MIKKILKSEGSQNFEMSSSCDVQNCKIDWEYEDSGTEFINRFCEEHGKLAEETAYSCFGGVNVNSEWVLTNQTPIGGWLEESE